MPEQSEHVERTEMQREHLKAEARAQARLDIERWGPGRRATIFTDGLGALGMGTSLDPDSPAQIKQREYDRIMSSSVPHVA